MRPLIRHIEAKLVSLQRPIGDLLNLHLPKMGNRTTALPIRNRRLFQPQRRSYRLLRSKMRDDFFVVHVPDYRYGYSRKSIAMSMGAADSLAYMDTSLNWRTMTFGQRVRATRKLRKLSQEKLVKLAGIKQSSLSNIERDETGLNDLKAATLLGLARGLRVRPEFLVSGDGQPDDIKGAVPERFYTPREELILEYVQKLNAEQQEELLQPLRAAVEANDTAKRQLKGRLKIVSNARVEEEFGLPKAAASGKARSKR